MGKWRKRTKSTHSATGDHKRTIFKEAERQAAKQEHHDRHQGSQKKTGSLKNEGPESHIDTNGSSQVKSLELNVRDNDANTRCTTGHADNASGGSLASSDRTTV